MSSWLLIAELIISNTSLLSIFVEKRIAKFFSSGDGNNKLYNPGQFIAAVLTRFEPFAVSVDRTDGISLVFKIWRVNVRKSKTMPLLRLNVESKGDVVLMQKKTQELLEIIRMY